jgi:hypothetical protein
MLVACGVAGLSALEAHYAGIIALTQSEAMTRRVGKVWLDPSFASSPAAAERGLARASNSLAGESKTEERRSPDVRRYHAVL